MSSIITASSNIEMMRSLLYMSFGTSYIEPVSSLCENIASAIEKQAVLEARQNRTITVFSPKCPAS
jgi:hypothetical protein